MYALYIFYLLSLLLESFGASDWYILAVLYQDILDGVNNNNNNS
jgi:hypothetical protein